MTTIYLPHDDIEGILNLKKGIKEYQSSKEVTDNRIYVSPVLFCLDYKHLHRPVTTKTPKLI